MRAKHKAKIDFFRHFQKSKCQQARMWSPNPGKSVHPLILRDFPCLVRTEAGSSSSFSCCVPHFSNEFLETYATKHNGAPTSTAGAGCAKVNEYLLVDWSPGETSHRLSTELPSGEGTSTREGPGAGPARIRDSCSV